MPRKKIDGVIEAVRYQPDGKIETVRLYQRRGSVWSDHILVSRSELVTRLAKGHNYVTGQRQPYLGSWLTTHQPVRCERDIISTAGSQQNRDLLPGIPVF